MNAAKGIYVGGLLANSGSGWHIDAEATALMKSAGTVPVRARRRCPTAAPRSRRRRPRPGRRCSSAKDRAHLAADARAAAGSARRLAGAVPRSGRLEGDRHGQRGAPRRTRSPKSQPPRDSRATTRARSKSAAAPKAAPLLRQTASGWSDERHEVNVGEAPLGNYEFQDLPYTPDPVIAMLLDPSGSERLDRRRALASIGRRSPPDRGHGAIRRSGAHARGRAAAAAVPTRGWATFAIAGNAECLDPCAERSLAGVGPHGLARLGRLARSHERSAGVHLHRSQRDRGQSRGASLRADPLLGGVRARRARSSHPGVYPSGPFEGQQLPAYSVASPPDLDARPESEGTEQSFEAAFAGFPQQPLIDANGAARGMRGERSAARVPTTRSARRAPAGRCA